MSRASLRAPTADVPALQRTPEYQSAARAYRAGDRSGALAHLQSLLAQGTLTPAQREYLLRQVAICQGDRASRTAGSRDERNARHPIAPQPAAPADCGPRALQLVCRKLGVDADVAALGRAAGMDKRGTTLEGLAKAARTLGLTARGVQVDRDALARLSGPAVAWVDGEHYLAVLAVDEEGGKATVHDPNQPHEEAMPAEELLRRSGGILLLVGK